METNRPKKLAKINQLRLDVRSGKNRSSEFKGEFLIRIGRIVDKIQDSSAFKNGKLTSDFLNLNPGLEKILYPTIEMVPLYHFIIEPYVKNESNHQALSMFELKLYRLVRIYQLLLYGGMTVTQSSLSSKHFVGVIPVFISDETLKEMKIYESKYKEIKEIYKIAGLLNRLRKKI